MAAPPYLRIHGCVTWRISLMQIVAHVAATPSTSGGSIAAAAGRVTAAPRVEGPPAQLVVGVPAQAERRCVGATDDDGARALPIGDRRAVGRRHEVLERGDPVGGRGALLVDIFFDR